MKFSVFFVVLVLPFALAVPVNDLEGSQTVLTPAGPFPASNIHAVPKGGSVKVVGNEIHLLDASNNVVHVAQADHTPRPRPDLQSGWIAYANWINYNTTTPINYFNTTWTVPPVPATYNGQLIYLFNSLVPIGSGAILQPVLQYGLSPAGGGAYWAVANWYLVGSNVYHTSIVAVNVGQVLQGIMLLLSSSGSGYDYISLFNGIGDPIYAYNSTQLAWATETLEAYGVTAATDYPAGSTLFSNMNLFTTAGIPSASWYTINDVADNIYASIEADGAVNAQVRISYPTN